MFSRSIRRLTGSLLRKPILVTHIHTVFRTCSRKVLILISTGSGWGARRLDIGLNLHHQALLLLCVWKCEKRRLEDEMLFLLYLYAPSLLAYAIGTIV